LEYTTVSTIILLIPPDHGKYQSELHASITMD